jgi:hypothetical protein
MEQRDLQEDPLHNHQFIQSGRKFLVIDNRFDLFYDIAHPGHSSISSSCIFCTAIFAGVHYKLGKLQEFVVFRAADTGQTPGLYTWDTIRIPAGYFPSGSLHPNYFPVPGAAAGAGMVEGHGTGRFAWPMMRSEDSRVEQAKKCG